MNKEKCIGCEDDFYNHRTGFDGATECWSLKSAKLIKRKKVSMNQVPPWTQQAGIYPSCYHQKGYVFVGENQEH